MNKKAETARDRRVAKDKERRLLDAALQKMNTGQHQFTGALLHDRIIGALELCCRRGEMLMIQNKRVNWDSCQIGIPSATAKDKENRRIPFNPKALGPAAFVFGRATGSYQPNIQTAWETLWLLAHGIDPKPGREGAQWNREQLEEIDLRWHDLRHSGRSRLQALSAWWRSGCGIPRAASTGSPGGTLTSVRSLASVESPAVTIGTRRLSTVRESPKCFVERS